MTSKLAAPGADARHPHPDALLTFVGRYATTLSYIERTAAMIRRDYPGSAAELLPKLRALYLEQRERLPYI